MLSKDRKFSTKLLFFLLFFLVESTTFYAQTNKGVVKGRLVDSTQKETMKYGTVALYNASDTVMVTYVLTDDNGQFIINKIALDRQYRITISYSGYKTRRETFKLDSSRPIVDFGNIEMQPSAGFLDEVVVSAERPPVIIKKDTIEFNATSFKMLPNALVEDLLKKLPGVEVDADGNILVNGKRVNRLLIEGKEFFGSDPKVATKNLPSNIIDKVQAVPDKEAIALNPLLPEAQQGMMLNLTLKKNIKKGAFGKVYAGLGTDHRIESGGILNMFRDTLQLSLLGYYNNINSPAFGSADLISLGGFKRSSFSNLNLNSDGSVKNIDGLSFGGNNQGVPKNSGAGINFNTLLNKNITLNFQYFLSYAGLTNNQISNSKQFVQDSTFDTFTNSLQTSSVYNHRIGGSLRIKLNNSSSLLFRPSANLSTSTQDGNHQSNTTLGASKTLNTANNITSDNQKIKSYRYDLNYSNSNFNKKNNILTFANTFRIGDAPVIHSTRSENKFYDPDSVFNQYQIRNANTKNLSSQINMSFTKPLAKSTSLKIVHSSLLFSEKNSLYTFDSDPTSIYYKNILDSLSYKIKRNGFKTTNQFLLQTKLFKSLNATIGLSAHANIINNYVDKNRIDQRFYRVFPYLDFNVGILSFSYSTSLNEPSITDIYPVVNNSNPLYQLIGNPNLKPTTTHDISLYVSKYFKISNLSIYSSTNFSIFENAIIHPQRILGNGTQIISSENQDHTWRLSNYSGISKRFRLERNTLLNIKTNLVSNISQTYTIVNDLGDWQTLFSLSPSVEWNLNLNDKFQLGQRYQFNYYYSEYRNNLFKSNNVNSHLLESSVILYITKKISWEAYATYQYNPSAPSGIQESRVLLNGSLKYLFLKNNAAMLKISVNDLLNQNASITTFLTDNYIQNTQSQIIRRYFMLTFIYNIQSFGGSKK